MSDKDDVGLFVLTQQPQGEVIHAQMVCRVVQATILTAQAPSEFQLITYRVGWWPSAPERNEDYTTFVCPRTEDTMFAMRIQRNEPIDVEMLNNFCINHFLSVVLPGTLRRSVLTQADSLLSINRSPWTFNSPDRKLSVVIYDAQHHEGFGVHKGESLRHLYSTLSYSPLLTKVSDVEPWGVVDWNAIPRLSLAYEYVNQTRMVDDAAKHLMLPENIALVLAAVKEQTGGK